MPLLTRIDTEPRPFTPEPITDEEAAALFRAALNLFRLWGVTDDQAAVILDLPRRTFARWKAGELGRIGRDRQPRPRSACPASRRPRRDLAHGAVHPRQHRPAEPLDRGQLRRALRRRALRDGAPRDHAPPRPLPGDDQAAARMDIAVPRVGDGPRRAAARPARRR